MKILTTILLLSNLIFSAWNLDQLSDQDFRPSKQLNWQTANFGIKASSYIYDNEFQDLNNFMTENDFDLVQEIDDVDIIKVNKLPVLADLQASVYKKTISLNHRKKNLVVVVFRGTDSKYDITTDLNAILTRWEKVRWSRHSFFKFRKPMVHRGFLGSVLLFQKRLDEKTKQLIEDKNSIVFITGHSLGGSLATIYGAKLIDNNKPSSQLLVYTYGAAGFANKYFVRKFKKRFYLHRIHNKHDVVVRSTNIYSRLTGGYQFKTGKHSKKDYISRIEGMLK